MIKRKHLIKLYFLFFLCPLLFFQLPIYSAVSDFQWICIDCPESDITIKLPEFTYDKENPSESSIIYTHIQYPHRHLIFTKDVFPEVEMLRLKTYVEWFTESWVEEDASLHLIEQKHVFSEKGRLIPMILRRWGSNKGTIHKLYFTHRKHGYCLWAFCYPPEGVSQSLIDNENRYWEDCLQKIVQNIESR